MKKIALAALALVAAGAAMAEVTSGNIVGYVDVAAAGGVYTPMSVMFGEVGINTLALTNITFTGIARGDTVQIFGNAGDVETTISMGRNGWNDPGPTYLFQPGNSFWLRPKGAVTVRFPGEVKQSPLVIQAAAGVYTPMGNGTAAPVALTNMTFEGIARGDTIQIFGNAGDVETTISMGRNGWNDPGPTYVFQPGEEFWLRPKNAVTVTFPAPAIVQ